MLEWVAFTASLLVLCVAERVVHALLWVVLVGRGHAKERPGVGHVFSGLVWYVSTLVSGLVSFVVGVVSAALTYAFLLVILLVALGLLRITYDVYPSVWFDMYNFYNVFVGPALHVALFIPLEVAALVFRGLVPLWNGFFWIVRVMLTRGVLPIIAREARTVVGLAVAAMEFGRHSVDSVVTFVGDAEACYQRGACAGGPDLDLRTPGEDMRAAATLMLDLVRNACPILAGPMSTLVFPWLDRALYEGVHLVVNAFVHAAVAVPLQTDFRCRTYGRLGAPQDALMCTPDLDGVFERLIGGLVQLGQVGDRWAQRAYDSATARVVPSTEVVQAAVAGAAFGVLEGPVAAVGLVGQGHAFVNGTLAIFQRDGSTFVRALPMAVDPTMGAASVALGAGDAAGSSVMACRCDDTASGLAVQCAVVPPDGAAGVFDVWFQDDAWRGALTCAGVELSVRSVRWPVRRFEGVRASGGADCVQRGNCEAVDATVWLVPKCGVLRSLVCSEAIVGTNCYPYCMAARLAGSKLASPVFVSARDWRLGKQLMWRDCAGTRLNTTRDAGSSLGAVAAGGVQAVFSDSVRGVGGYGATFAAGPVGAQLLCAVTVAAVSSAVAKTAAEVAAEVPFVRASLQPFVIAGDVSLISDDQPDGGALVQVERLAGDQRDVFTVRRATNAMPSVPRLMVPADELDFKPDRAVLVPYSYQAGRVPATTTRGYLFYAVSPDLSVFEAFLDFCKDPTKLPKFQFMILSSFGALRVYRVRTYCDFSASGCVDGMVAFAQWTAFAWTGVARCPAAYNASIEAIDYFDEDNIAVVMRVAGRVDSRELWFLHPETMAVQREVPWASTRRAVQLAADLPPVGSLVAQFSVMGVQVVRFVLRAVASVPGVILMWRGMGSSDAACGIVGEAAHGHSVVESCGHDVISLDDYFDAVDRAGVLFWNVLMWAARLVEGTGVRAMQPLADLIRGGAYAGQATIGGYSVKSGVAEMLGSPVLESVRTVFGTMQNPTSMMGLSLAAKSGAGYARYSTGVIMRTISTSVEAAATGRDVSLRTLRNTLYDSMPLFTQHVSERGARGCEGLRIMMGGANPWGNVVYGLCMMGVHSADGLMHTILIAIVEAPIVKCVCRDSAGHDVREYALGVCVEGAPMGMRPALLTILSKPSTDAGLCSDVLAYVQDSLQNAFEPWFSSVYGTLEALGDSVDYALVGIDASAGQCVNVAATPEIVVLVPSPMDYFQGCARIVSCRSRCVGEWSAFSNALALAAPDGTSSFVDVADAVESLFFPLSSGAAAAAAPGQEVVALAEPSGSRCLEAGCVEGDPCVAVAAVEGAVVVVRVLCVPQAPSAAVAQGGGNSTWSFAPAAGARMETFSFLGRDAVRALVRVSVPGTGSFLLVAEAGVAEAAVLLNVTTSDASCVPELMRRGARPMSIAGSLALGDGKFVVANVGVRRVDETAHSFYSDTISVWISVADMSRVVMDAAFVLPGSKFFASEVPGLWMSETTFLLWPKTASRNPPEELRVRWVAGPVITWTQTALLWGDGASRVVQRPLAAAAGNVRVISDGFAFFAATGQQYDWLVQVRVARAGEAVLSTSMLNSQTVAGSVRIRTGCDGVDCRGCGDPALRSLCVAYQGCSIHRCVGTPVNLQRPLCGVGRTMRSAGMVYAQTVHGMWVMFTELFMVILRLANERSMQGVRLTYPTENVYGHICAVKDLSADMLSIVGSTINGVLQQAQVAPPHLQAAASVDTSARAVLTMGTAGMVGFLNQILLLPAYMMAVGHKTMMCNAQGLIGILGGDGFSVVLSASAGADDAASAIGGRCLTQNAEVQAQQTGDVSVMSSVTSSASELVSDAGNQMAMLRMEPIAHLLDGVFAYFMGIVFKFGVVLQSFDLQNCVVPDVEASASMRCPCGDDALRVRYERDAEGVGAFAHWCVGTLGLTDAANRQVVVYNPYSMAELRAKLADRGVLDAYLACLSGAGSACEAPGDEVLRAQGVNLVQVMTRCRQNFASRRWDPLAYVLYDEMAVARLLPRRLGVVARDPTLGGGVGACLADAYRQGHDNDACKDAFVAMFFGIPEYYWGYEKASAPAANADVDGCVVFSGPAKVNPAKFARETCSLSGHVWSPASGNEVPVAARHVVLGGGAAQVEQAVLARYYAARDRVLAVLDRIGSTYDNARLRVEFFSAEGDVVHQLADCVFMGPYARVDYWPGQERCTRTSDAECLAGPFWSRDEGDGMSRGVDIANCTRDPERLPLTCGSPLRKSMMRYFVQHFLLDGQGGGQFVLDRVNEWIRDVRAKWMDVSATYGCKCPASASFARHWTCCAGPNMTVEDFTPDFMRATSFMQLNTSSVLVGMAARMREMYSEFLVHASVMTTFMDPAELARYDWSTGARRAKVEAAAAFDPGAPALFAYDAASEANSPPSQAGGVRQRNLWEVCHGAVSQVMFTLPVDPDTSRLRKAKARDTTIPVSFAGGNLSAIDQYVRVLLEAAEESSPLARHHALRHHPSNSSVCTSWPAGDGQGGRVSFADFAVDGITVLRGADLGSVPALGEAYGLLGAPHCLCGWTLSRGLCQVPAAACAAAGGLPGCAYSLAERDAVEARLLAVFSSSWPCPDLNLTEHVGMLDRDGSVQWLAGARNITVLGASVLGRSPGGLVAGNVGSLQAAMRASISPADREVPLEHAGLQGCDYHATRVSSFLSGDAAVFELLFPMAQGVPESRVGAYCMRYALELARLRVMEMAGVATGLPAQRDVVHVWRERCGGQVAIASMCRVMDVFRPNPLAEPCPSPLVLSGPGYLTPQCLANVNGVFYDVCACMPDACVGGNVSNPRVVTADALRAGCPAAFDPSVFVDRAGEQAYWASDIPDADVGGLASALNDRVAEAWTRLDLDGFISAALAAPSGAGFGNVAAGLRWHAAEGFMADASQFCDHVADYWDEDAEMPVGYHVTVPCAAADTAYRSFDGVFAREDDAATGLTWMTYFEDQTRDASLLPSYAGVGGLCRAPFFGMPLYETNTMRLCTRRSRGEDVDVHVPTKSGATWTTTDFYDEACSASSTDVPWTGSGRGSLGAVPLLPDPSATTYPDEMRVSNVDGLFDPGNIALVRNEGWGAGCADYELPTCGAGSCPADFVCRDGVCVHVSVACVRHADCPADQMCSGVGTCHTPLVVVWNQEDTSMAVKAHTASCPGSSFSMLGASPWGYVPDLLESHGMCSYMSWREYTTTLAAQGCTAASGATCTVDSMQRFVLTFDEPANPPANRWWANGTGAPSRLAMVPVTCDRDYERFRVKGSELRSCVAPSNGGWVRDANGNLRTPAPRDRLYVTHRPATHSVPVRVMPFATSPGFGFLGSSVAQDLRPCSEARQCFADIFTVNGAQKMTTIDGVFQADRMKPDGKTRADPQDIFRCGMVGVFDGSACRVDTRLFPLVALLCGTEASTACASVLDTNLGAHGATGLCSTLVAPYAPSMKTIQDVIVPAIADLYHVFKAQDSLASHVATVACMESLYAGVKARGPSSGVYFPFAFTVLEMPFPFFFQCLVGENMRPSLADRRMLYPCQAYRGAGVSGSRVSDYAPLGAAGDDFTTFVRTVRGGYRASSVAAYAARRKNATVNAWTQCVANVQRDLYGGSDGSRPFCFQETRWRIADAAARPSLALLLVALTNNMCSATLQVQGLRAFNAEMGTSYSLTQVVDMFLVETTTATRTPQEGLTAPGLLEYIRRFGVKEFEARQALERLTLETVTAQSRAPVVFDAGLPGTADDFFDFILPSVTTWFRPRADGFIGVQPSSMSPDTCKNAVGGLEALYSFPSPDPTSIFSISKICPVRSTGLLSCGYTPVTLQGRTYYVNSTLATSTDFMPAFRDYLGAVYGAVSDCYTGTDFSEGRALAPDLLPMFEEEQALAFPDAFALDLTAVNKYVANIDPDPSVPVMCKFGNQVMDYTACTDPNYAALKDHVSTAFTQDAGMVATSQSQLGWSVSRGMMDAGFILSYTSTDRNLSQRFVASLFDDPSSCASPDITPSRRVCSFKVGAKPTVVTPWLDGLWNPYAQCDIQMREVTDGFAEYISATSCVYEPVCPTGNLNVEYYTSMPNRDKCVAASGQLAQALDVEPYNGYNLCWRRNQQDDICLHNQGMLGGTDGMPSLDYTPGDLYTLHDLLVQPDGIDLGLFGNPLFRAETQFYGLLRIPAAHIGGHVLGVRIRDHAMHVHKIPLKPLGTGAVQYDMTIWDTDPVETWTAKLVDAIAADDDAYRRLHALDAAMTSAGDWDCVFRRRAYYAGHVEGFRPAFPSARRSRRLFGNLTTSLAPGLAGYAHPMQARADGGDRVGRYKTPNGACYCPVVEGVGSYQCAWRLRNDASHPCSLQTTVRAVLARNASEWFSSYVFVPRTAGNVIKPCTMQLDWPFVGGPMRDGARSFGLDTSRWGNASEPEAMRCHVLDRLPPFMYRYKAAPALRRGPIHTLQRGGVCHTGRVQDALTGASGACFRVGDGDISVPVWCSGSGKTMSAPRRRSRSPRASLNALVRGRQRCSQCSGAPRFRARNGAPLARPESSFGLPYRVSSERALAASLLRALCADGNVSSCRGILNADAWRAGAFMDAYVRNPKTLFRAGFSAQPAIASEAVSKRPPALDDAPLWARPWVYCASAEALRDSSCEGSIPRDAWRKDRFGTCHASVQQALRGKPDPMGRTSVCTIGSELDALCRAMVDAANLVSEANCIASGDPRCAIGEFVYTPATWDTSNQAFVRATVRDFYERADPGACMSDTAADQAMLAAVRAKAAQTLQHCSASPAFVVHRVLQQLRNIVNLLVRVLAYIVDIEFQVMLTFLTATRDSARRQLAFDFAEIKRLMSAGTGMLADMIFDIVTSAGSGGPWLKRIITTVCSTVNWAVRYFREVWCFLVIDVFPKLLYAIRTAANWLQTGFETVNDVFTVILRDYLPMAYVALLGKGYYAGFLATKYAATRALYGRGNKCLTCGTGSLTMSAVKKQGSPLSWFKRNEASPQANTRLVQNLAGAGASSAVEDGVKSTVMTAEAGGSDGKKTGAAGAAGAVDNRPGSSSSISRTVRSTAGAMAGVGGTVLGGALFLAQMGLIASDVIEAEQQAAQIARAMTQFPEEWTIFDFSSLFDAIDFASDFFSADDTCYASQADIGDAISCDFLNATDAVGGDDPVSPVPTSCYAEASERQAGISTLYACTGASSCATDALSGVNVLCMQCPFPSGAGFARYGCNTMLQTCQCGVPTLRAAGCYSNRDCKGDASSLAGCVMLSALDAISFGTMPCANCTSRAVCLAGQCTCFPVPGNAESQLCDARAGTSVVPDPARMCGRVEGVYSYYYWDELAMVRCSDLRSAFCAQVTLGSGATVGMVVGVGGGAAASTGTGRRLLQLAASDAWQDAYLRFEWNRTSMPCSGLAEELRAGHRLGPVDTVAARACLHWRRVGSDLVRVYNLTALADWGHFLLSFEDFFAALRQRGVLASLLANPAAALEVVLSRTYLADAYAFLRAALEMIPRPVNKTDARPPRWNRTASPAPGGVRGVRGVWVPRAAEPSPEAPLISEASNLDARAAEPEARGPRRRLLEASALPDPSVPLDALIDEAYARVRASVVYAEMAKRVDSALALSPTMQEFVRSEGATPAWMHSAEVGGVCPPVQVFAGVTTYTLRVVGQYYTYAFRDGLQLRPSAELPSLFPDMRAPAWFRDAFKGGDKGKLRDMLWFQAFDTVVSFLGIEDADVVYFLNDTCKEECTRGAHITLKYAAHTMGRCDFEGIMLCTGKRRSLLAGVAFVVALNVLAGLVAPNFVQGVVLALSPLLVTWYVYAVSPSCVPLVPTCLVDDVVELGRRWLPLHATLPGPLVADAAAKKLRPCGDLGFTGAVQQWSFLAALGEPLESLVRSLSPWAPLDEAQVAHWKRSMAADPSGDTTRAYVACWAVQWTDALPILLLVAVGAYAAAHLISLVGSMLPVAINLLVCIFHFNHSKRE